MARAEIDVESPFTIDNIPFGVITTPENLQKRCATAYGNDALELSLMEEDGCFRALPGFPLSVFAQVSNAFIQHSASGSL